MNVSRWILRAMVPVMLLGMDRAVSQTWPAKPIQIVVPAGAGGLLDNLGRMFSQPLSKRLGQPVVIDNKTGATGGVGLTYTAKANPDGYTIVLGTSSSMVANVFLYRSFTIDPLKDLTPLGMVLDVQFALLVPENSPYRSVKDLVAAAKATPGKLNYGAGTSSAVFCAEMFKSAAGIDLVKVPYRTSPQALTDLMAGRLDVVCEPLASLQLGKVRALAATGEKRSQLAPNLETAVEAGYPEMVYSSWVGFWAPRGIPKDVATRLSNEIMVVMKDPEVLAQVRRASVDARPMTPEDAEGLHRAELKKIGAIVKTIGLVAE